MQHATENLTSSSRLLPTKRKCRYTSEHLQSDLFIGQERKTWIPTVQFYFTEEQIEEENCKVTKGTVRP